MKYQMFALCLASSLFACRKSDDGPKKSLAVNAELLQGYWSPAATAFQLKSIEDGVNSPLLYINGSTLSMASKSNPLFQCPDERGFTIEADTIRIPKSEACPEQNIKVLSSDAGSLSVAVGSEKFQFYKAHVSLAEIIINNAFADISGLSSPLKALYQEPPADQEVDSYISTLETELKNLKLVVPDASVFSGDGMVSKGELLGKAPASSEKSLSCAVISKNEEQKGSYEKVLSSAAVHLPRKDSNAWDYVIAPDIESLRTAGLSDEEITDVLNRPRQGRFSNNPWRGNRVQLVNDDFGIYCSQPLSLGLITVSQIREALGTLALLKSDR
ncbi:MAG TPA: hypothetical protein VE954_37260 [Oligoflexus sp.]|uniref:hypothetical protein n=1 Tax=Oligoflexus sp. TaxID=1971216 RepID=UPI002D251CD2|nr:hypothetical protein [Oligoflexus sp.]HYX38789.1 hypothetical protein [Oligoflexus sp.]